MDLVPMGLLLHSHRALHEIRSRMALHEIHLLLHGESHQAAQSAAFRPTLNQIALTSLLFGFFPAGAAAPAKRGAKKCKMKIFFLAPGLAIVSTVAGQDQT